MRTAAVLLCLLTIASCAMACLAKIEASDAQKALEYEQARKPFMELMRDPDNGDIYLRADRQHYYHFRNACRSIKS